MRSSASGRTWDVILQTRRDSNALSEGRRHSQPAMTNNLITGLDLISTTCLRSIPGVRIISITRRMAGAVSSFFLKGRATEQAMRATFELPLKSHTEHHIKS